MINSIEIKNFKSIKKKLFPLRNLNILLGLNGMGKSSFIQSLLTLKQSSSLRSLRLDLNGNYVTIGNTRDALYQYAKQEDMEFDISFTENNSRLNLAFEYKMEADLFMIKNVKPELLTKFHDNLDKLASNGLFSTNFQYLNANRIRPVSIFSKNYTAVINEMNVGNYGEFTAHYIETYSNEDVFFENLAHKDSGIIDNVTRKKIVNKSLINQINLWMGEISPGINIRTTSISSEDVMLEYVFKQPNFGNTNRYKPENVGFGITYVLPVVTALLAAKRGELIIIENPESHIHPRGQAELGRLIAKTAMNDVQIIIETHSDHILNGIRVAVKESDITKDRVIAFYFEKVVDASEQYSKISDIEIDKNGELSNYPKNMLDEWSNQLFKLM